ncbi:hypothetical protein I6F26_02605 [Ensifer sp. IC3342]|nr:hypothetical protein [Ensifer sp. BRP08]MCA1445481.1 hypothetical protein [Ensifer sp. IC3342]
MELETTVVKEREQCAAIRKEKVMRSLSVTSMLLGVHGTPVAPGSRMEKLGAFLGVPDRWDFGIEDEFICQLGYADFEISLRTRGNQVEVERVWLELWHAHNGEPQPKKSPIRLVDGIDVDLGVFQPGISLSTAKALLDSLQAVYEESTQQDASEVTSRIVLGTKSELLFFRGDGGPRLMEIHFYADDD